MPLAIAVIFIILLDSLVSIQSYVGATVTAGAETRNVMPLVGASSVALALAIIAWPKHITAVLIPLALFLAGAVASMKNTWIETPMSDVLRALAVVVLSSAHFVIGAALRQRGKTRTLQWVAIAAFIMCFALMAVANPMRLNIAKNNLGGTAFELIMLIVAIVHASYGKLDLKIAALTSVGIIACSIWVNQRSMMAIGAVVGPLLYLNARYPSPKLRMIPPIIAIFVAIGVVVTLTGLTKTETFSSASKTVEQETGRGAKSGREKFWPMLIDAIERGPKLGYGPTAIAKDVTGLTLSTHNSFIQIAFNYGFIGLFFTLCIFFSLGSQATNAPVRRAGGILSVYLVAVILHDSFEDCLFMNNFPIASLTWLNFGFMFTNCSLVPISTEKPGQTRRLLA